MLQSETTLTPPAEVEAAGQHTNARVLAQSASRWPDRPLLLLDGERLSYAQMLAEAERYAAALLAQGAGPGTRIGILGPNSVEYVKLLYAAGMIGACAITLNARFKEADLVYALDHAEAGFLFIGGQAKSFMDFRAMLVRIYPELQGWDGKAPLSLAAAPHLRRLFNFGDPDETVWPDEAAFLAAATPTHLDQARRLRDEIPSQSDALIIYSSGTTAHPKACILSHRNLSQIGMSFARRFRLGPEDVVYNPMPFFHMSSMLPMAACRAAGAMQICTGHFKPQEALRQMQDERATFAYVSFPTIVGGILNDPGFAEADLSSVRLLHCVGPADLLRRYSESLPGVRFVNAYGLTEGSGVPVWSDPWDPADDPFTHSGKAFDGLEIAAFDPETDRRLPPDTRGELRLRGFCRFSGYLKDEAATAQVLRADGWLCTGDLGYVDAGGIVTYDGRLKDMLKIGGENVAALEIESYLCTHPDIELAQVIAVPDGHLFEVAAAYVELRPGARLTAAEVVDYCLGRIASYKVPRYVRFVTEWPMSTTKIQKFRLSREFAAEEYFDIKQMMAKRRAVCAAG
ncbi:fatty-acyl-CoA synthase [Paracoccus pantotrophus]|uniref:Acyl--CoA ligase n=1 Tax=Paracoccus pantotrophus TaxID=82367 RepID=A0AAE6TTD0_PARPN|nr:class I adenylate-forming enzyme family protein [Paracoccus pantotrophus]QFG36147.1 acyl--CoA ligase [Paracoccus pantotrophus]RKS43281.1 fatty-acyl-CoA synthase [Paracoccus pantotrophus]